MWALGLLKKPPQMQALAPELGVSLSLVLAAAPAQLLEEPLQLSVDRPQALRLPWLVRQNPAPPKAQERDPEPALIPETGLKLQGDEQSLPSLLPFQTQNHPRVFQSPGQEPSQDVFPAVSTSGWSQASLCFWPYSSLWGSSLYAQHPHSSSGTHPGFLTVQVDLRGLQFPQAGWKKTDLGALHLSCQRGLWHKLGPQSAWVALSGHLWA